MTSKRRTSRRLAILAGFGLVGAAGACSTVSPDEMDTGMASLREEIMQEMQAGDQQVAEQLNGRIDGVEQRIEQLEQDLQSMEREFEVTVQRLEDQLRFDVPVYFGFDEAELQQQAHAVLDRFGAVTQEYYPSATITVEGFTDPSGPAEYNRQLGQRRADAVRDYLLGNTQIGEDQVRAVSYGEDTSRLVAPQSSGPGQEGWENRRVVLVIDHDGNPPARVSEDGGES